MCVAWNARLMSTLFVNKYRCIIMNNLVLVGIYFSCREPFRICHIIRVFSVALVRIKIYFVFVYHAKETGCGVTAEIALT